VDLSQVGWLAGATWHLGLTAVIEDGNRRMSYWSVAHPQRGLPDFHHRDCLALELPAPQGP